MIQVNGLHRKGRHRSFYTMLPNVIKAYFNYLPNLSLLLQHEIVLFKSLIVVNKINSNSYPLIVLCYSLAKFKLRFHFNEHRYFSMSPDDYHFFVFNEHRLLCDFSDPTL